MNERRTVLYGGLNSELVYRQGIQFGTVRKVEQNHHWFMFSVVIKSTVIQAGSIHAKCAEK